MAAHVNAIALTCFDGEYLGDVPAWPVEHGAKQPASLVLRRGTVLLITQNLDIERGLVNGAECTVVALQPAGVVIQLVDGSIDTLHMTTRRHQQGPGGLRAAYNITHGYAWTVHKAEGQTLDQVILVFEDFCPRGWGYTAITRARSLEQLLIIGNPASAHFQPRRPVRQWC
jgi:ATP-dependent exoDNAse (exonuclease V) alpha subunit